MSMVVMFKQVAKRRLLIRGARTVFKRLIGFAGIHLSLSLCLSFNSAQGHENHWQSIAPQSRFVTQHNSVQHTDGTLVHSKSVSAKQAGVRPSVTHGNRWINKESHTGVVAQQGWYRTTKEPLDQTLTPARMAVQQHRVVGVEHAPNTSAYAPIEQDSLQVLGRRSGTLPPVPLIASSTAAAAIAASHSSTPVQGQQLSGANASSNKSNEIQLQTINLDLFVGEVRVMGPVEPTRVAVGNGSIVDAKVIESNELLIIATAVGSTSLRLWNKDASQTDYNIRVSEHDPQTRVRLEPMVRMRVRMVEFRKSALGKLGIDWSDSASGPTLAAAGANASSNAYAPIIEGGSALPSAANSFSTYFGITSNIASRINFLAQNGDAVTLAEPVLSAINGGEASFLAGGEVPYPSVGQNGQTQVEFKDYGVKLNVAPLIDNAGNVRARLETEISQLDSSVSVQGAPGLLTRRAQTEVTVRSGETIVISGLLSSESSGDVDMIPGIGKLPVIGRFFSSRSKRNSVSELVIFVTPEVIEPQQPMINAREQRYLQQSDQRLADVKKRLPLME